jgi:tripartite-type tricarboxylate transporter receptor subunit TctC
MQARRRAVIVALGLVLTLPGLAPAQSAGWPTRPVRIIVPYTPGGLTDSLGRLVAERLRPIAIEGVIVENRPGAGSLLGGSLVAKAPPDGHTLGIATSSTMGISPALFANPPMRANELTGLGMLGAVTLVFIAHPDFPASNLTEAIAVLKAKPGEYKVASPGNGTPHHLLSEMLKRRASVSAQHVPYPGSAQALPDLIAGRTDLMILDASVALPLIKSGKVKALATTAPKRSQLLPNVQAMAELFPDMDLQVWQGVVGPNGLPADISARLQGELTKAMASAEFRNRLVQMGVEPLTMTADEFNAMVRRDEPRWAELVKASGAKVD